MHTRRAILGTMARREDIGLLALLAVAGTSRVGQADEPLVALNLVRYPTHIYSTRHGGLAFTGVDNRVVVAGVTPDGKRAVLQVRDATSAFPVTAPIHVQGDSCAFVDALKGGVLVVGTEEVASWEQRVYYLDASGRTTRTALLPSEQFSHPAAVSPDGRIIATAIEGSKLTIKLWDSRTSKLKHELPVVPYRGYRLHVPSLISGIAFSPDSRMIGAGTHGHFYVWETTTGNTIMDVDLGEQAAVKDVAFSPDGRQVAVVGERGVLAIWDIGAATPRHDRRSYLSAHPPDGSTRFPTPSIYSTYLSVAYSHDGSFVVAAGREGLVVMCAADGTLTNLCGSVGLPFGLAVAPDDRSVAFTDFDDRREPILAVFDLPL